MPKRAAQTERVAGRAVRRGLMADAVGLGGLWLMIGAAVGLALVGFDRLWPLSIPIWVLVVGPPAGGLAFAIVRAGFRRRSLVDAVTRLDESLGLRDALGNGLALAGADDPFAELAVRDAERVAADVDVRSAVPVRWGGAWLAWPVVCATAVIVWVYVPRATWGNSPAIQTEVDAGVAADQIRTLVDETREELADIQIDSSASAEALESIDRLEDELRGGERTPDDARLAAAESFDQLADEMEQNAEHEERVDGAVRDSLSGLDMDETGGLADRLREGDFEAAREAARESLRSSPEMSDAQRERLQREFTDLADAIEELNDRQAADETAQSDAETSPPDVDDMAEQFEREGIDPDTARRLAERQDRDRQDSDAEDQVQRDMEQLRDALRDAAEEMNEQPREEEKPESQPPNEPPPADEDDSVPESEPQSRDTDAQNDESHAQDDAQSDGKQEQGDQNGQDDPQQEEGNEQGEGEERQSRPDERGGSEQGDQPGEQQGDERDQRPGGERVPREQPTPGQGEEPTPEQQPDGQELPEGDPEPRPSPQPGGNDGESQSIPSPGQPDTADPGDGDSSEPTGEQQPIGEEGVGEDAFPGEGGSLDEALRRMAERGDQIERQQQQSERMRERAQELLDNATPEQLEQLERWGEAMRSQQAPVPPPTPSALDDRTTTPADLRPSDLTPDEQERERVIAEWFSDEPDGGDERATSEVDRRVREAADSALRAVEDQAVPVRRRELIKRVFDGVKKRSTNPPAEQGQSK